MTPQAVDLAAATVTLCGVCLAGIEQGLKRPARGGRAWPPSPADAEAYVPLVQAFARAWQAAGRCDRDAALVAGVRQFMIDTADGDARSAAIEEKVQAMLLDYVREMTRHIGHVSGQAPRRADA